MRSNVRRCCTEMARLRTAPQELELLFPSSLLLFLEKPPLSPLHTTLRVLHWAPTRHHPRDIVSALSFIYESILFNINALSTHRIADVVIRRGDIRWVNRGKPWPFWRLGLPKATPTASVSLRQSHTLILFGSFHFWADLSRRNIGATLCLSRMALQGQNEERTWVRLCHEWRSLTLLGPYGLPLSTQHFCKPEDFVLQNRFCLPESSLWLRACSVRMRWGERCLRTNSPAALGDGWELAGKDPTLCSDAQSAPAPRAGRAHSSVGTPSPGLSPSPSLLSSPQALACPQTFVSSSAAGLTLRPFRARGFALPAPPSQRCCAAFTAFLPRNVLSAT